ncbi:hypothetical protein [Providencia sp. PROV174]|uniref:hypothetical protein n=1 Tax=Providencia sp. PROV174 TaxID=2949877 RepID=UPI00234B1465|nr:hypothetical protein [Providencia sp. PROV174]
MDVTIIVAIITGFATLLAAVWAHISIVRQKLSAAKLKQREDNSKTYVQLLLTIQKMMNSNDPGLFFHKLQEHCITIYLLGDKETAIHVNAYIEALVDSASGVRPQLEQANHKAYQRDIINAMRAAQKLQIIENGVTLVAYKPE